jgi:hypothetical protein
MHISASPGPATQGRRARVSVRLGDVSAEVIEDLDVNTWDSDSITFDPAVGFTIDSPQVQGSIATTPLHVLAPFSGDDSPRAFGLDKEHPLQHYQRSANVTGRLTVGGREVEIDGQGYRDRTWGFRDESASIREYYGTMWVFPDFSLSMMKLLGADGSESVLGFVLPAEGGFERVTSTAIARDASGLFAACDIGVDDGRTISVRNTGRTATFWCPMGFERSGPVLSSYDEWTHLLTADGVEGFGLLEQGIVRQLS